MSSEALQIIRLEPESDSAITPRASSHQDVEEAVDLADSLTYQNAVRRAEGLGYRKQSEFLLSSAEAADAYDDLLHDLAEAFQAGDLDALRATAEMINILEDNVPYLKDLYAGRSGSIEN
jgi:hypothetical protein